MRYRFSFGADLRKPTDSQASANTAKPRDMPVYFPAFAGTNLYCLVTEAVGCEQLAQGCYAAASRPGLEPVTTRSQVRRPTTKPPRQCNDRLQRLRQTKASTH